MKPEAQCRANGCLQELMMVREVNEQSRARQEVFEFLIIASLGLPIAEALGEVPFAPVLPDPPL